MAIRNVARDANSISNVELVAGFSSLYDHALAADQGEYGPIEGIRLTLRFTTSQGRLAIALRTLSNDQFRFNQIGCRCGRARNCDHH